MEPPPRSGITSRSGLPRFASLSDALREHGIPLENHSFIRQFTDAIGIEAYFGTTEYIKAVRTGAGPDLNIAYGWSNGFVSEEEARLATGDTTQVWTSSRATGLWGVTHPMHGSGNGGGPESTSGRRDYGTCPTCFTKFAANGSCPCEA